jgi:hypothetical protein
MIEQVASDSLDHGVIRPMGPIRPIPPRVRRIMNANF